MKSRSEAKGRDCKLDNEKRTELTTKPNAPIHKRSRSNNLQSTIYNPQFPILLFALLLLIGPGGAEAGSVEQTTTTTTGGTSDYLSEPLRLLYPSAPASLELKDVETPIFSSDTPGFDFMSLGTLTDPAALVTATPTLTKTLTLELGGGFRGRVFASPPWLDPLPDRFINPNSPGKLQIAVTVREDAGQGAGLLPGQTNWGHLLLSLNGALFDYSVPLIVGSPARVTRNSGDQVFGLYRQIVGQLDRQSDLDALIGTPTGPNGGQLALGLTVDYLGENEYNQRLDETGFVNRVSETLAQKDYNGDGWVGFKPEDIVKGAPGWALGHPVK